jgi:hypothetical protein
MAHEALMQVYQRLGANKPYQSQESIAHQEKSEESTGLLSCTDTEEESTHFTVYVSSEKPGHNSRVNKATDNATCSTRRLTLRPRAHRPISIPLNKGSVERGRKESAADEKPYRGLFEANHRVEDNRAAWEIRDLRQNVTDGDKTCTEKVLCWRCGVQDTRF